MSETYSTREILNDTLETVKWLKSLNLTSLDQSRIPDILKYLELYVNEYPKFEKGEPNNLLQYANEAGTAFNEATALNLMRRAFTNLDPNHLPKKKIEQSIQGSFHSTDEDPSTSTNHARNTLFELETAAFLISKEYDVTTEFEDVNFYIKDSKISIQCKRPIVFSHLKTHFEKAVAQLINKNKIIDDPNSFGLIAISLEKLYRLDTNNLIRLVKDKSELAKMMRDIVKDISKIIEPYRNSTIKKYPNIKLVGLMYLYKTPVIYQDTNVFSYKRQFLYNITSYHEGTKFRQIAEYIESKVQVVKYI